jgi:hypothetical protein
MNEASLGIGSENQRALATPPRPGWLGSLVLGAFLLLVYLINGRNLGTDHTYSATLLPRVILYRVLLSLKLRRAALPAVIAACLGSDLWTVRSQAAWQHGPAGFSLFGTLFSPNRGLLVFSPWVAVALATLAMPAVRQRLAAHSLICVLLASLVPYLLMLSKYSVWWGGHSFGPRYSTDAIPLFAILFAFGLEGALTRSRALGPISVIAVVFSIAVQIIGAFCYPSTWNSAPLNVDLNHNRLWDWRDSELSRCLIESYKPPDR